MLYIFYNPTDYLDYIFDGITLKDEVTLVNLNKGSNIFQKFLRKKIKPTINFSQLYFGTSVSSLIHKIGENDTVLLIDYVDDNIINCFTSILPQKSIKYLWFWNPLYEDFRFDKIEKIKSQNFKIFTFNQRDQLKFSLQYLPQFYNMFSKKIEELKDETIDIYFLGFDKGRSHLLNELKESLSEFKCFFKIVNDHNHLITYTENIINIQKSKCILDITQVNQEGLSLRPLEAIAFNKKLITNNLNIVNYEFYKKENIFIIGRDSLSNLKNFLNSDFIKIDYVIKQKHDVNTWINSFKK